MKKTFVLPVLEVDLSVVVVVVVVVVAAGNNERGLEDRSIIIWFNNKSGKSKQHDPESYICLNFSGGLSSSSPPPPPIKDERKRTVL